METSVYSIRCLTNLHAGSGDADYGIVDKLVQRDPITNFPTIHMSSLKGALREYFKNNSLPDVSDLFGSAPNEDDSKMQQGKLRFISADFLAIPKISEYDTGEPYTLVHCEGQTNAWTEKVKLFNPNFSMPAKFPVKDKDKYCISLKEMQVLTEDLPVVARNFLDNGESKNLWYEEFVPRKTIFGFIVQGPATELKSFYENVHGQIIQIGGNATVGYGFCLFDRIYPTN